MSTRMEPVAGQQAQRAWAARAVRQEVGEARPQHPNQAETMTTRPTGLASIAPSQTRSRPPSARYASNADSSPSPPKSTNL